MISYSKGVIQHKIYASTLFIYLFILAEYSLLTLSWFGAVLLLRCKLEFSFFNNSNIFFPTRGSSIPLNLNLSIKKINDFLTYKCLCLYMKRMSPRVYKYLLLFYIYKQTDLSNTLPSKMFLWTNLFVSSKTNSSMIRKMLSSIVCFFVDWQHKK